MNHKEHEAKSLTPNSYFLIPNSYFQFTIIVPEAQRNPYSEAKGAERSKWDHHSPFTTHYSQFTTIVPERSEWDNNSRLEIVGQGHWGWVAIADTSPRDYLQQNQEQADTRQGSAECAQKIDPIIVQPRQPALVHGFSPAGVLRMLFRLFLTGRAEIDRL